MAAGPAGSVAALDAAPFDYLKAESLSRELGLRRPTAVALVRRGIDTAAAVRDFLADGDLPAPEDLAGIAEAVAKLRAAAIAGNRITVYGDFDVDGVCGTAILVAALRRLGADCDWFIPDRVGEGYGLSEATVERLAARGTELLVTVDCGITAVAEVQAARRLGLEVIVTDHHRRAERLPDCLIVHPGVSGYSCPDLCGAAVAWKLATALSGATGEEDLDLVALATVADLVPLRGENRSLVKRGLAVARRAARPGIRALSKASALLPEAIDESDLGFRLAPRINAAGRLYRADAGVELLLTGDDERAEQIAGELNRANQERRDLELRVLGEAESELRRQRDGAGLAAGLVVSGGDWHPGVIGIVASRLVELHRRPAVVISLDRNGRGRGSGRAVPGFDLLAALEGCDDLLGRYGGHRMAAGLELEADRVAAFAERFAALTESQIGSEPSPVTERVDAFAAGPELGLELAEELARLGPFGIGNPAVNLVIPSARVADVRPMGDGGDHLRFTVHSGGHRARAVAFARKSLGCDEEGQADLVMRLERNEWNGGVEPRLRLREIVVLDQPGEAPEAYRPDCPDREWWDRFETAYAAASAGRDDRGTPSGPLKSVGPDATAEGAIDRRPAGATPPPDVVAHEPGTGMAVLAELLTSGASVLAVAADAARRSALAVGPHGLARFARGTVSVCSARDGRDRFTETLAVGFGLVDYGALMLWPGQSGPDAENRHVVLIDPPASAEELEAAQAQVAGSGRLHSLWDESSRSFALRVLAEHLELRRPMTEIYRALRDGGEPADPAAARVILEGGETGFLRTPEQAAACLAALAELGLVDSREMPLEGGGICARRPRVVSSNRTDLERSSLYRRFQEQYEVKAKFLRNYRQEPAPRADRLKAS